VLTLQARSQDILRSKSTSNVFTNQTLMAIAATIHMSWLGPEGLQRMGEICARRTAYAASLLSELPGCSLRFAGPTFKEIVLRTPIEGSELVRRLAKRGFLAGPALGRWYSDLHDCVLLAVTERRSADDIEELARAIEKELAER